MKIDTKKLQLAMARSCINSQNVAKRAGVTSQTVRRSMSGKNIKPDTVGRIAKALGVDPYEIIKEDPQCQE